MYAVEATDTDLPVGQSSYGADSSSEAQFGVQAWSCTIYASDPRKMATPDIVGEGFQSCFDSGWAPQRIRVSIQRKRWYGWQTMDEAYTNWSYNNWVDLTNYYYCRNVGTWTYRVVTTGWAAGGSASKSVQSEHYLRAYC